MEERTKIAIKIALVVLLLGPLIFLRTCFPLGLLTLGVGSGIFFFGSWLIALILSIYICYIVIKKIKN